MAIGRPVFIGLKWPKEGKIYDAGMTHHRQKKIIMFTEKTAFILGAGASWHYGYPTGEELISHIKKRATWLSEQCRTGGFQEELRTGIIPEYFNHLDSNDRFEACNKFVEECEKLSDRLNRTHPLLIDYFLDQNCDLQKIGKLFIAHVILECEQRHKQYDANFNHRLQLEQSPHLHVRKEKDNFEIKNCKDNWYRFVIAKIISNYPDYKDLSENKVNFITFNYDVSLERQIYRAIELIRFTDEDKKHFFETENLVIHPYGQIRAPAFENRKYGAFPKFPLDGFISDVNSLSFNDKVAALNQAWSAAQTIKTISEAKRQPSEILERAMEKIKDAKRIFILGYGFDQNNNDILKIKECLNSSQRVFFTNLNNSKRINGRVQSLFQDCRYETSTRNIYDALEFDFDL